MSRHREPLAGARTGTGALTGESTAIVISPRARRVAVGVGATAVLLAAIDTYVVVTLLTEMAADMHVVVDRIERANLIVTGFLLGYVSGMPLLGGLSDKLGRRAVIQISLGGFLVGSVITAGCTDIANFLDQYGHVEPLPFLVVGRTIQGFSGGALLPVTMALVADLWAERRRPTVLGTVGAAQELGSVLGPLYGAALAALIGWRGIFWINVPLAAAAMVAVHFALPGREKLAHTGLRRKVDVTGGLLLAASLGLLTAGLNNQDTTKSILPPHGPELIAAGAGVLVLFLLWEWRARTKLIDLSSSAKLPFFAVLAASFIAGSALLVTLLDISLLGQGVFLLSQEDSAKLLVRFLVALPVGAVLGGLLATRLGLRMVSVIGFVVAALAYWLVSTWQVTIMADRYHLIGLSLPRFDTDLALAGLGLGMVIAPLSAAILRIVPPNEHGVASAGVVVARTIGMLIGYASLTVWALHRFHELAAGIDPPQYPIPTTEMPANSTAYQQLLDTYNQAMTVYTAKVNELLLNEYHVIFRATALLCVVAAAVSLAIATRRTAETAVVVEDGAAATA